MRYWFEQAKRGNGGNDKPDGGKLVGWISTKERLKRATDKK